jgi:hypothetical protein
LEPKKILLARNAFMPYYYVEVDTSILNVMFPKPGRSMIEQQYGNSYKKSTKIAAGPYKNAGT